jgi:hypothetical protein
MSEQQLKLDYRICFSSEQGGRVLKDLEKVLHLFEPTYHPADSHETAFREGERNALLYILSMAKLPEEREKIVEEELDYGGE